MTKNARLILLAVFALALSFLTPDARSALAQTTVTGDWSASTSSDKIDKQRKWDDSDKAEKAEKPENPDKLYLSFERRTERGGHSNMGSTYDYSELQGLTREQAERGGAVSFRLVREAGTIECEGSFQNGRGSGTFRFTPNAAFVSAMKARGFDFEKEEEGRMFGDDRDRDREDRLFAAATINVTTALADDLLSADFGKLGVEDLFKAAIFKVDSKFMREMKESGFPNLTFDDLVKARIFKIDAAFVREAARMGFDKEPFESLVKMRIFKVTPEFVAEVRNEGLTDISIEDLVKMKIFKIDAEFIRRAKADGTPLDVEELVQKRIGVRARTRY